MAISADFQPNEEYTMQCAEAMLGATLALMTGHAQSSRSDHRQAMADKIVDNLSALSEAPLLSPGFQILLRSLCSRWLDQGLGAAASKGSAERRLWHASPKRVQ